MNSIAVIGSRWFQRSTGNTYHTAEIIIDGETVYRTPEKYGYGNQFLATAAEWLEKNGYMPGRTHHDNGSKESLYWYCDRMRIVFTYSTVDVSRKRDL